MFRRLLATVAGLCLAAGCNPREAPPERDARAPSARAHDTLRAAVLFDGDALGRPQSIGVLDDWLLVSDVPRPNALHVIRRSDGRYLKSWGREGGGPGEFRTLWSIQPAGRGSAWLYDPGQTRLTLLDVPALLAGAGDPVRRSLSLRADLMPMTALWASDTLLVSSGDVHAGQAGDVRRRRAPAADRRTAAACA